MNWATIKEDFLGRIFYRLSVSSVDCAEMRQTFKLLNPGQEPGSFENTAKTRRERIAVSLERGMGTPQRWEEEIKDLLFADVLAGENTFATRLKEIIKKRQDIIKEITDSTDETFPAARGRFAPDNFDEVNSLLVKYWTSPPPRNAADALRGKPPFPYCPLHGEQRYYPPFCVWAKPAIPSYLNEALKLPVGEANVKKRIRELGLLQMPYKVVILRQKIGRDVLMVKFDSHTDGEGNQSPKPQTKLLNSIIPQITVELIKTSGLPASKGLRELRVLEAFKELSEEVSGWISKRILAAEKKKPGIFLPANFFDRKEGDEPPG